MDSHRKIRLALRRIGETDILLWAERHGTTGLAELNRRLDAGVDPAELQRFMADAARSAGRYDDFIRTEAVRWLNEYFHNGFCRCEQKRLEFPEEWAMWSAVITSSRRQVARETWKVLENTLQNNPGWCPSSPNDPLVLQAFQGKSFGPTEAAEKFAAAVRRMSREVARGNRRFTHAQAVMNLSTSPRGYGWLYGMFVLDGQVSNGGFEFYYNQTAGWPTELAIEGFRRIGQHCLAQVVAESLSHAFFSRPEVMALGITLPEDAKVAAPRSFVDLDEAWFRAQRLREPEWLEAAMTDLVVRYPSDF